MLMRGPIDYLIVGFEGNKFDGSILKALSDALESGVINLIALALVAKDKDGNVTNIDAANLGDEVAVGITTKYVKDQNAVSQDDIDEMSDLLENNTSAGMLVIEHTWAIPLKKALLDANGVLVADGRIHPDAADELNNTGGN
jgi:hypothetical protein